ncbi:hypothetical protein J2S70_001015 [Trueperella bonasi]|uniref:Uncharacterized protein n=1 Tax=Trueperella bonasi TaxID=312286 RepID=A0ABT9NI00_9ACTO|nr:hypothetical protein [Trueperella bonasi]MDP9806433.1 hypothetical protein [Trueperella bonasi]
MKRVRISVFVSSVVILLIGGAFTAQAEPTDSSPATIETLDGWETTFNETTQSEDPTAPNFVPAPTDSRYYPSFRFPLDQIRPLDASGTQFSGGFTITVKGVPVRIPRLALDHQIFGKGLVVSSEWAKIIALGGNICNYQIEFQNRWGNTVYRTDRSPIYNRCVSIASNSGMIMNPSLNPARPRTMNRGVQCARLKVNGVFVTEQCHSIVR